MVNRLKRNIIPLGLISFSLLLLVFFMAFWLHKAYQEQYEWLQKETSSIFLNTTRNLQDSLIETIVAKNVIIERIDSVDVSMLHLHQNKVASDSALAIPFSMKGTAKKTVRLNGERRISIPTDAQEDSAEIRLMIKSDMDQSMVGMISSVFLTLRDSSLTNQTGFKIKADSIRLQDLYRTFAADLNQAAIDLDFVIHKMEPRDTLPPLSGLQTSVTYAGFDLSLRYFAHFPELGAYLFKKIVPHILFSIFLISLTAISFFFIFRSLKQQQKLTELKNDLIRNITHELKTPVTTVGVAIEALSNFNALQDPERTRSYLQISKNELNRLSILIDKVLKMAIFEQKGLVLKVESLDLKILVEEILASMRLQFEKQKAKVDVRFTGADFMLEGDRIHLTSVIYNLIDNALKYTQSKPEIEVELHNSEQTLRLVVADNGIGIAAEHRDKIFEKFYRIPTGDEHNTKGYGLGLSYVANVIQKHHGSIHLESQPGNGSRFSIRIPRKHGKN